MRRPQLCDQCGGRFGLVTHRWLRAKFCRRTCKDAYLRELALRRDRIQKMKGRRCGHPNTTVHNHTGQGRRSRWEISRDFSSLILFAKEPSMLRGPRAMLGLLVVGAAVAWMVLLT
jgi:hypothetical protein